MLKTALPILAISTLLAACQPTPSSNNSPQQSEKVAGLQLVKVNQAAPDGLAIPYKKYLLDNGLTVILHEDNSDPLVHVDVTYHVGSAREEVGKSGFAHFFEHMMFQGSENVADEQHFKLVTEAGGSMNGTTNTDRTNYYQTVPANQLEKMLWLEADRMGFLLDAVTQEKFEVQRETVKNERAQRVDNQPYGLRTERISEALYPEGHPYSWPVIGYIEDLNRVNVDDLKVFFQTWYGPNNAVLTIGGNIDEAQTLEWIVKYFGPVKRGPAVEKLPKTPVTLEQDRYLTLEDNVHLPLIQLTFPTVHIRHEDEAPLDVLSDILGGGKTSLFYKNMVKDGFAVHAGVGHPCQELACQFELIALPNPQKITHLKDLEKRIRDTLVEFESRGVNEDDLTRVKASIESGTIYGLQSVSGKVSSLAYNQYMSGEPDRIKYDLARYNSVTKEDVMRVFNRYIKDKATVVLSIVPKEQAAIAAKEQDFDIPVRNLPDYAPVEFVAPEKIVDNFDRSVIPKSTSNPVVQVPDFWEKTFANGMRVLGHQTSETPTISITLNMEGGPLLDPIDKAGLASMTARLMQETTKNFSNEEIANELAKLGSSISFSAGGRFTTVQVNSLSKNVDATLELLKEKLFNPAFIESDFVRMQQRLIQSAQQQVKNPEVLSGRAISKILYGTNNRIGLPDSGTLETIANLTLEDVKQFYERYYTPALANLVVVGDIDQASILEKIEFVTGWKGLSYEIPDYESFPMLNEAKLYLVDKPDAAQSIVTFVKPYLPYDALGQQFKSKLMNFPLGGMFNSRINLNLREDKGYTYGARSGFAGGKTLGRFSAGGAMKKENTIDAINELIKEISQYQKEGMSEKEVVMMRNAYTQREALQFETPSSKAGFLRHLLTYDLDKGFAAEQNKIIKEIELQALNELASKQLDIDSMQLVLVADKETLLPEIEKLAQEMGRKIELIDVPM